MTGRDDGGGGVHGLWMVLASVAVAVASVGSVVEIFHGTGTDVSLARAWGLKAVVAASPEAPAATAYGELATTSRGPNAQWQAHLDTLRFTPPPPETHDGREERRKVSLAARASRRAYDGAPPVIPHEVSERSSASCVACHGEGLVIGDRRAPRMAHPPYQSCTQCHARGDNPQLPSGLEVDNTFVAKAVESRGGPRAWSGAPPTTPHSTWMREECASCHGVLGPPGLRTTHPERASCTQCHAPSASLEGGVGGALAR